MATVRLTPGDANPLRVTNAINKNAGEHDDNAVKIADLATETEAEEATVDNKWMSPLKTLTTIQANLSGANPSLDQLVTDLTARVANLEAMIADALNTFVFTGNGWVDPYDDSTGIHAAASSNYVRQNGYLAPNATGGSVIAGTSVFSNSFSSASTVRNGVTNVAQASCAAKTINGNTWTYIGYVLTSPGPIDKLIVYGSNDQGFVAGGFNPNVFMQARAHASTPPGSTNFQTFGTVLTPSTQIVDTANESAGRTLINTGDRATSFSRVWILIQHQHSSSAGLRIAEIEAYSPLTTPAMTAASITHTVPTTVTQISVTGFVEIFDPLTVNTDIIAEVSANGGTNWTTVTLVDESSAPVPGGSTASIWRRFSCPLTTVGVSGTQPKMRWKNGNNKYFRIHETRMRWAA